MSPLQSVPQIRIDMDPDDDDDDDDDQDNTFYRKSRGSETSLQGTTTKLAHQCRSSLLTLLLTILLFSMISRLMNHKKGTDKKKEEQTNFANKSLFSINLVKSTHSFTTLRTFLPADFFTFTARLCNSCHMVPHRQELLLWQCTEFPPFPPGTFIKNTITSMNFVISSVILIMFSCSREMLFLQLYLLFQIEWSLNKCILLIFGCSMIFFLSVLLQNCGFSIVVMKEMLKSDYSCKLTVY